MSFSICFRLVNNAAAPPISANSSDPVDKGHAALVEPSAAPNLALFSDATLAEPANQAPTTPAVSQSSPGEFFISFFFLLTDH